MSHFIAKSITISKNKGIVLIGDDNNVYPRYDREVKSPYKEETLKEIMKELLDGCIQPVVSANNYRWWWIQKELVKAALTNIDDQFEMFKQLLETRQQAGEYVVEMRRKSCCDEETIITQYLLRDGRKSYASCYKDKSTKMPYWKALYFADKYAYAYETKVVHV